MWTLCTLVTDLSAYSWWKYDVFEMDFAFVCQDLYRLRIWNLLKLKQCWKIFPFCLLRYSQEKVFCEGLTEGKFSFSIIHNITIHPHDSQVICILLFQIHSFWDTPKTLSVVPVSVLHLFYSSCNIQHNLHHVANMYKSLIIYIESMNILAMVDPWSYT